jgi:DNA-binding response OmpR family regulator
VALIIVVDDDPNIRELLGIHLRNAGHEVVTAKDGIEGGHAILKRRPDLIVTDAEMPHMTGFELVEALRADPALSSIPVVMLTSRADWDERGKGLGIEGYVTKPIRSDNLLHVIDKCLKRAA